MNKPMSAIQAEFDEIARASNDESHRNGWDHNSHYHPFLLKHLPPRLGVALEIGCGTGAFARLLAARCDRVLALDLSPEMIRQAKERSADLSTIEYQQMDILEWNWPVEQFDCIVSIATLHHIPLEPVLIKMKAALKPGGVLLILDLYQADAVADVLKAGIAFPLSAVYKWLKNGRVYNTPAAQAAWEAHGKDDVYLRVSEVRRICDNVLPGAQVRKHLFWRYALVWKKTA